MQFAFILRFNMYKNLIDKSISIVLWDKFYKLKGNNQKTKVDKNNVKNLSFEIEYTKKYKKYSKNYSILVKI